VPKKLPQFAPPAPPRPPRPPADIEQELFKRILKIYKRFSELQPGPHIRQIQELLFQLEKTEDIRERMRIEQQIIDIEKRAGVSFAPPSASQHIVFPELPGRIGGATTNIFASRFNEFFGVSRTNDERMLAVLDRVILHQRNVQSRLQRLEGPKNVLA
jgi:hypothetical protein